jgi:hypothetical protein
MVLMGDRVTFGASDSALREKAEPEDQRRMNELAGGDEHAERGSAGKGKMSCEFKWRAAVAAPDFAA